MKQEHELMNLFRRTAALSRRRSREKKQEEKSEQKKIRGMGHILDLLSEEEGKSQKNLAQELGVRPQSLTQALMLLETRGEILREVSPADRRVTLVFLTREGAVTREERKKARLAHAENFFSPLTEEEQKALFFLLQKLCDSHKEKEVAKCPRP